MRTGSVWVNNHRYLINDSGRVQFGWINYSGNYFFANPMRSDQRHDSAAPEGAVRTGRVRIHDRWHQFSSGGFWQGHARGHDPNVHTIGRWRPASSGETVIPIQSWNAPNTDWITGMNRAFNDWNLNNTSVRFTRVNFSHNTVAFDDRTDATWLGLNEMFADRRTGYLTHFRITMNRSRIYNFAGESGSRMRNYVTSVFAHELAHAVGLDDNPRHPHAANRNDSIMNTLGHSSGRARDRNVIFELTPFDIANVSLIY